MAQIHVNQIKASLTTTFQPLLDLSDVAGHDAEALGQMLLTRAQAAFVLAKCAMIEPSIAATKVTDGTSDNGIDAIFFSESEKVLFIVQSKWHSSGHGSIARGDIQKFLKGATDILAARWDRFNERIQSQKDELQKALEDSHLRIRMLVTHTGVEQFSTEVESDITDFLKEHNNPVEIVSFEVFSQGELHRAVQQGLAEQPISSTLTLYEWGTVRVPSLSYYGQVAASDIAQLFIDNNTRLFAPNIRSFLGATSVNDAIYRTLIENPELFWSFNNGITLLCHDARKKPLGGDTRDAGTFDCHGVHIANGAQTVGAIARAFKEAPTEVCKARVHIRIITLKDTQSDFETLVTRNTNTQNRVDRRDFVSLDPEQSRLRTELELEGVTYVYKSGEHSETTPDTFDLEDATLSLVSQQDELGLAVQAKREIGKLWEDISKAPYKSLFNPGTNSIWLWRGVQAIRKIDGHLQELKKNSEGRSRLVAIHGNRFIQHVVFNMMIKDIQTLDKTLEPEKCKLLLSLTDEAFNATCKIVENYYSDQYPASLFKNLSKCIDLRRRVQGIIDR